MTNDIANPSSDQELETRLAASWPVLKWCDTHVVLGVSGGADSVAMLRAMVSLKSRAGGGGALYVAHVNHGLRGAAGDRDEAWVRELCGRLAVPLEVWRADVSALAAQQGDGWEAAARSTRYDFLRAVAEKVGARFVVTAHTADDQVETVLHRILRGTGIDGLAGISKARSLSASVALVRPMLDVTRAEVLEYLAALGQDFRTDATNEDTQWTRNRLRHELLTHLRERYNPQVSSALLRLAAQAGEAQQLISDVAESIARQCVDATALHIRVDCGLLAKQPAVVVREVLKLAWRRVGWGEQAMGFEEWQQLARLVAGDVGKPINLPGGIRAERDGDFVVLETLAR